MAKYLDETGLSRFWNNIKGSIGSASDAQVNAWLTAHPEATTTVQDGAITTAKLANGAVTDAKLAQSKGVLTRVSDLRTSVRLSNKGRENLDLYANFVNGTWVNGELLPQYSYRVSSESTMTFDRNIVLSIATGFRIALYYFEDDTYTRTSGYQTGTYKVLAGSTFAIEIDKVPEVIGIDADVSEFVHAVELETIIGDMAESYANGMSETIEPSATYSGYYTLNGSSITAASDLFMQKFAIPYGTTRVYVKTKFFGLTGVAFSDVSDPTAKPLSYPANCTKDPLSPYLSLTDHEKTYTLDYYYKYVYVPYYKPWGTPTVIAYRDSAFKEMWDGIHPLDGKNVLVFGDSIAYTSLRWRDEFYRLTRANELACISNVGAHLTDYNTTTPLDGNYTSTADGGVHNVVCNQVYYWLTNMPSQVEPDIIIISASTNDTQTVEQLAVDLNVYTDSSGWLDVDAIDRTSFDGAMRWITSKLREEYTNAAIVFASPIQSAEAIHKLEYQLAKEAKMEKVCKRLSARLIKATSESGITGEFEVNNGMGRYLNDGLHPNELGGVVLGTYYANALETMFKN